MRSMFLEGAGWDKKNAMLVEPAPMQLVYDMPVIHFKPTERLKKRTKGIYIIIYDFLFSKFFLKNL